MRRKILGRGRKLNPRYQISHLKGAGKNIQHTMAIPTSTATATSTYKSTSTSTTPPLYTLTDLIRRRAAELKSSPLLAYPRSKTGVTDYEEHSAQAVDGYVDAATWVLVGRGLRSVVSRHIVFVEYFAFFYLSIDWSRKKIPGGEKGGGGDVGMRRL